MPVKKTKEQSFFRPLMGNAISHAWYHRELWPIAAIAGIAGIGAGINDILTQARLSSTLPETNPLTLITSVSFTRNLLESIIAQGPYVMTISVLLMGAVGIICAIFIAWCQHIIIQTSHHAITSKPPVGIQELIKNAAHPRVMRIFTVNILIKILTLNVIIISGMLIAHLNPTTSFFDALFGTIFSASILLIAFFLNVLGMLALIHIVKKNSSLTKSLEHAWKMLRTYPITCIELSLGLFAITFAISLIAIVGLVLIGSLSIPFFGIMISQGTLLGMKIVTFGTVLLGATWAVAMAGFSTLTTYLSWTSLSESLETAKGPQISRSKHHTKRTLKHLFG